MNILYATDGSEGSLEAARFLTGLARRNDIRVDILAVPKSTLEEDQQEAAVALSYAHVALGAWAGCVTTHIAAPADSARTIAERIVEGVFAHASDMVVMGTHGRSALARWFTGSVALNVTRHAPCPVLIARSPRGAVKHVLAGVDGSPSSEEAVRWMVGHLPLPSPCELRLAGIVTLPALVWGDAGMGSAAAEQVAILLDQERERLAASLKNLSLALETPTLSVTKEIWTGDAADGLRGAAQDWEADLLTVGSHGLSGIEQWILGSVSESVLQRAPCSVLVVRQSHKEMADAAPA